MTKENIIMEIRPAEGGDDSKLLIHVMKDIYIKTCKVKSFDYGLLDECEFVVKM